jgi:manganese/zinc/iron transport system ATP- binding protein
MPQLGAAAWDFPLTVLDVALQGGFRRVGWLRRPGGEERRAAGRALAAVGMDGMPDRQVGQLSGGQRQRVLLARALVQDAGLLLLDEPLSGADAPTETMVLDTLRRLRDEGRTVIVSTHDLGWAARHCDLLCLLSRRVIAFGPPAEALDGERLADAYGGELVEVGGLRILAPEGHHAH